MILFQKARFYRAYHVGALCRFTLPADRTLGKNDSKCERGEGDLGAINAAWRDWDVTHWFQARRPGRAAQGRSNY